MTSASKRFNTSTIPGMRGSRSRLGEMGRFCNKLGSLFLKGLPIQEIEPKVAEELCRLFPEAISIERHIKSFSSNIEKRF